MEITCNKTVNMIVEFVNDRYSFINAKVLSEEPMIITMFSDREIELISGYGEEEIEKTNYELVENIVIAVIDDIREAFDLDCDYSIGGNNVVDITIF